MKKESTYSTTRYDGSKPPVWPVPTPRRDRIAAGTYHKPAAPELAPTVKPLPKKLAKLLRRMADGYVLKPFAHLRYGLYRIIKGVLKLVYKAKTAHIDRLEASKCIVYVNGYGWRLTALGRAAIGAKPAIDTSPLVAAAQRKAV